MEQVTTFFYSLYFRSRSYVATGALVALFILAYFFEWLLFPAQLALCVLIALLGLDIWMLYNGGERLQGRREVPERLSNGDTNSIKLHLENQYPFDLQLTLIDEAPVQFQLRKLTFPLDISSQSRESLSYTLRPTQRGTYVFGALNAYACGPIGLVQRRYRFAEDAEVPVYPSFLQMRRYQFMAISHRLTEAGVKKIRRIGHTNEFEQIKAYVRGDDFRTLNWKATARHNKPMVNQYADERSQQVYCLIDESRAMKMPFEGMTLLDYAINASLVLANIAIYKQDRAGLVTFAERVSHFLPADNRPRQMNRFQETLYKQKTRFLESDYGRLYAHLRRQVSQRSLLILFTNFESITALHRQLPHLKRIAKNHLLLVVFFENTELGELIHSQPDTTEDMYIKTIGEHFALEKKQIVKELERHGIMAMLSPPKQVTVNALNKYLEIKARGRG